MKINEVMSTSGAKEFEQLSRAVQADDKAAIAKAKAALVKVVGADKAKTSYDHIVKSVKERGKSV